MEMKISMSVTVARFEVFTAVKIQLNVFCAVTLCGVVVGYQHFGGKGRQQVEYPTAPVHGVTTQTTSTWKSVPE
jgi:hypothetical protein